MKINFNFRPTTKDRRRTVRLTAKLDTQINFIAEKENVNYSDVLREMAKVGVNQYFKQEQVKLEEELDNKKEVSDK